jgi:geranylgeranyl reductase family protein
MQLYDVIVVGMGPAGATAAAHLGRAGYRVLGLEWKSIPRYKVCGGGLTARLDTILDPAYRSTIEEVIHTIRFQFAGREAFQVTSPEPLAYMVMRDRFDAQLVRQAQTDGVEVRHDQRVTAVMKEADAVEVRTSNERYRGRIVVGADGANSIVARSVCPERRRPVASGIEGEAFGTVRPGALNSGMILLDIGMLKGGYAWIFPKHGNLSIGAGTLWEAGYSARRGYQRFLQQEPMLDGLAPPQRGHAIPVYSTAAANRMPLLNEHAVLVGDAAHLVDPLLGEGIYYAVLSGRMAAKCIAQRLSGLATSVRSYEREIRQTIYPEFQVAEKIAWWLYTFPRISHRFVQRRPDLIQLFFGVLRGEESYESFHMKAKRQLKVSLSHLFKVGLVKASRA